jgi:hypothetical protein
VCRQAAPQRRSKSTLAARPSCSAILLDYQVVTALDALGNATYWDGANNQLGFITLTISTLD